MNINENTRLLRISKKSNIYFFEVFVTMTIASAVDQNFEQTNNAIASKAPFNMSRCHAGHSV